MGFDQAFGKQIETVFVSEFDEPACKTYRANFNDPFEIAGDITKIDASDVPDFGLFGGFCGRDSGIGPAQRAKTTIWN